jgi:hypothetical protein
MLPDIWIARRESGVVKRGSVWLMFYLVEVMEKKFPIRYAE